MHTKNGRLYELGSENLFDLLAEEDIYKQMIIHKESFSVQGHCSEDDGIQNTLTELSEVERRALMFVPESERPPKLALIRFIASRKELKAPCGLEVKNAFMRGYLAALKDQGVKNEG